MGTDELTWLAHAASHSTRILEVGAYCGRTTRALADNCPGQVISIDIWAGSDGVNSWGNRAGELITRELAAFHDNLGDHIESGKVIPLRIDSVTWEPGVGQVRVNPGMLRDFDLIFLDGLHTYEHLTAEIMLYRRLLLPCGILAGHDYDHPDWYGAEVRRAVHDSIGDPNVIDYIWWKFL